MKSWEVLREAIDRVGVKALAHRLNLSAALVYKWCQEAASDDPEGSGTRNPLDRLKLIYDETGDERIINWLCNEAGGFFVQNPKADPADRDEELLDITQRVVQDFSAMLSEVSRSIQNDGAINTEEAERIRQAWERLKGKAESFVVACEKGLYKRQ